MSARLARRLHTHNAAYKTEPFMNTTLHAEQPVNTTIFNYPGFQTLPKGIKQMLVVTEARLFDQPAFHRPEQAGADPEIRTSRGLEVILTNWRHWLHDRQESHLAPAGVLR
jgi:hypothetical protein